MANDDNENKNIDKEDMNGVISNFHSQLSEGYKMGDIKIHIDEPIENIVITGMGGSALPGEILKSYLNQCKIPIIINKDYTMPPEFSKKSLVIAVSYSGDTEETIEAYREAYRKGANIVIVTSGGKLDILAKKQNTRMILIPRGLQPRAAYGYMTSAILKLLENLKIIPSQESLVKNTAETLKRTDLFKEKAEDLAEKLVDKIPLIYSSDRLKAVAYKWKISFNENTKIHAFYNVLPELNHNEMVGFTKLKAEYHLIIIKDEEDHPRIRKRMDILKKLVKSKGVNVTELNISGRNPLTKLFSAIYIGDWTSYFLAIKYGVDPTPVDIIQNFKKEMK
ncbi:MAG: bifunctional phosphoglucose/phosphomannose isomerase [Candidatus Woesearchaeota archaeon]